MTADNVKPTTQRSANEKDAIPRKPHILKRCLSEINLYNEVLQDGNADQLDYTAPLWLEKAWRIPEGLCGPLNPTKTDPLLERFYDALQHTLFETGLPETIDMTNVPKRVSNDQVTIAMLSSPVECLSVLLAGGEQCPGDMLLVLSNTWCTKLQSPSMKNKESLYVHQAVAFHKGGYTFLERYDPPRRVTYFENFLTNTCTGGACSGGEDTEKGLDCPMSSSQKLNQIIDDKLYTRIVLGKAGVGYPTTLAFSYKATELYESEGLDIMVVPVRKRSDADLKNSVRSAVREFIMKNEDASFDLLVVKPSGPTWFGSKFVSFHHKMDVEGITEAVGNLIEELEDGDCALVEEYIAFEQPHNQQGDDNQKYNVRIRSSVCRTATGGTKTTKITCGIGRSDQPINGDNTIPHSVDLILKRYGFADDQLREIRKDVEIQSEKTLAAIIENEKYFSEEKRGEVGAQTDVIGIDLILKKNKKGGKCEMVAIEVNSHDCLINCQVHEFINPNRRHEAAADLVQTMIQRSNSFLIKGKTLLIIGVGSYSKWFVFEEANRLGINVVLVDTVLDESMPKVSVFIQHDLTDLKDIEHIASEIIGKVDSEKISLDGCVSFWEDYMPIAAAICDQLKLTGSNFRAAMVAKNKYLTQKFLAKRLGDIPHFPRTFLYTSKAHQIDSEADIEKAFNERSITLPAVLKLLYGSSAVGVYLVNNEKECLHHFNEIQQNLDVYGVGLGFGTSMMLTDYIPGSEHDVDVIIFKRKLVAAFVSDNGPTRVPIFAETAAVMPSILDQESKNQLITAAYQCCIEAGLENGAFNVELKLTMTGPKLLEINGRMGGFYLRDWIKQCYDVDILLSTFLISLGINPHVRAEQEPNKSIVGVMCVPSEHLHLFRDEEIAKKLQEKHDEGSIRYNKFEKEPCCEEFEQPSANIAAIGPDATTAKKALLDLCDSFRVSTPTYDVEGMLSFIPS